MSEVLTLSCPLCYGQLKLSQEIRKFTCWHCEGNLMVVRDGKATSVTLTPAQLRESSTSADRTASELAIKRLKREIGYLEQELVRIRLKLSDFDGDLRFLAMEKAGKRGLSAFLTILFERDILQTTMLDRCRSWDINWLEELCLHRLDKFGDASKAGGERKQRFKNTVSEIQKMESKLSAMRTQLESHRNIVNL